MATHKFAGDVYLGATGDKVIHADGAGLKSESVSFDSIQRGTAGNVATFAAITGMLEATGLGTSSVPSANKLVAWDSGAKIDGVTISGGEVGAADVVISNEPTLPLHAATLEYVDAAVAAMAGGFSWQQYVLNFATEASVVGPADGDRYVASANGATWTKDNIYQWDNVGGHWHETPAMQGMAVTSMQGNGDVPLAGAPSSYTYTTSWIPIGYNGTHDNLVGKRGTSSFSSQFVQVTGVAADAHILDWPTVVNRACTCLVELVGVGSDGAARFSWRVEVFNMGYGAVFDVSMESSFKTGNLEDATASLGAAAGDMNVRVNIPTAGVVSSWHATVEGTFTQII